MTKPQLISETPVGLLTVAHDLEVVQKREKELNFRSEKTNEYTRQFAEIAPKSPERLYTEIEELKIPRLRDVHIHKLIDIMPTTENGVKMILTTYSLAVTKEQIAKLIEVIQKHSPKQKKGKAEKKTTD